MDGCVLSHQEVLMATINNVKDFIYEFTRQYHFDKMPAEVRARYEDYAKTDDFDGNMKYWKRDLEGQPLPLLDSSKLRKMYDMFQDVFETMSQNKKKFKDTKAVNDFFENWFGTGKVFDQPQPIGGVEARIEHFVTNVLDSGYNNQLERIFKRYNLVPSDFDYNEFLDDVKAGKYKTNPKLRRTLLELIDYAHDYSGGAYGIEYWPAGMPQYDITAAATVGGVAAITNPNTKDWFTTQYNVGFRFALPQLMKQLIDSAKIREAFEEYDSDKIISGKIADGIKATDYANTESTDYIEPKYKDQKNFGQRINEKLDKIKENNINPWIDILRGRRRFFSKHAQIVIEACSKVKNKDGKYIKPTDGLQAFIDNKDAILKKIDGKSPTAKSHFKWFVDRLGEYSTNMPDAFKGALKNARQMRAIVEQIIYDALNDKGDGQADSFAKAKTAMEILSTMKYGIMHSRMMDAFAKEDMTWLSDKGLSWNKYEAPQMFTKFFDTTLKYGALTTGRGIAALRNKWFRDHTKLRGKFRKGSEAEKAHQKFVAINARDKRQAQIHSRVGLDMFAGGRGKSGLVINDANLATRKAELSVRETTLATKEAAFNAIVAAGIPSTDPAYITAQSEFNTAKKNFEDLSNDIQRYEYVVDEKSKVATWDEDHPDNFLKLMAYWDMLETYRKSHHFTLAADVMRKKFLEKNPTTGKSKATVIIDASWEKYKQRYAA